MTDIEQFVATYVTKRDRSMFENDISDHKELLHNRIWNKKVLIIGGAGSIGSSFLKALLRFQPQSVVVVDINENGLAELVRDLRSTKGQYIPNDFVLYPMDYSSDVFRKMFIRRGGFDVVANFSAHKHVRSEKDIFSVEALMQNNVLHLKVFMDLLKQFPPEVYFCVSTDKAANPVNVMGCSKRLMEDVIFSYSDSFPVKTARFANVAFSNGSLPAGFLSRMQKKQPLSAPKEIKRYFVSLEESGQICLLACFLGNNREIFFPKLEEAKMMTFTEIAEKLLEENGYQVQYCESDEEALEQMSKKDINNKMYPVHFSKSDTSGEKDYEEFYTNDEKIDMERFRALGVIIEKEKTESAKVEQLYVDMKEAFDDPKVTKKEITELMKKYIPNFEHIEREKTLDSKM